MDLLHGDPRGAVADAALAHALLRQVAAGGRPETVRVARGAGPVVAFGRRDTVLPGYAGAVAAARARGFDVTVRAPGGRAVAYHERTLIVDHVAPLADLTHGLDTRFATAGELYVAVLRDLGVDARHGEVPGEYCPGEHSVNARGAVKLVGTAQRLVRGASLFSAVTVAEDPEPLRDVLTAVYAALDLPFDPATVTATATESPAATVDAVEHAVLAAYASRHTLVAVSLDAATDALAVELTLSHEVG